VVGMPGPIESESGYRRSESQLSRVSMTKMLRAVAPKLSKLVYPWFGL
jgi:hypothetical protein